MWLLVVLIIRWVISLLIEYRYLFVLVNVIATRIGKVLLKLRMLSSSIIISLTTSPILLVSSMALNSLLFLKCVVLWFLGIILLILMLFEVWVALVLYLLMINIILNIVIYLVAVIDIFVIILILVVSEITNEVRIHLLLTKHSLLRRLILLVLFVKVARQRIFLHFAITCLLQRLLLSVLLLFVWGLIKLRLSIRFLLYLDRLLLTFLIFWWSFYCLLFCSF